MIPHTPPSDALRPGGEPEPCWARIGPALERAALALGRLDAALENHPLLPGWRFRTELEAACRCAAADGRRVDPIHLAVLANGLPLDPDARYGSAALAYALSVRDALSAADRLRHGIARGLGPAHRPRRGRPAAASEPAADLASARAALAQARRTRAAALHGVRAALGALRAAGRDRPSLLAAALGAWRWLAAGGSRNDLRGALPLFLVQRRLTRALLPGLVGAAALDADAPAERDAWLACFLGALADDAAEGLLRLRALERSWARARRRIEAVRDGDAAPDGGPALRRSSRLHLAVDVLSAAPLLGPAALARVLGVTRAGASRMLARLAALDLAAEITGRGSHKLYALPDLAGLRGEVHRPEPRRLSAARRPADAPDASPTALPPLPGLPPRSARPLPLPAVQADLAAALAELDGPLRRVQATLARLAAQSRSQPET